MSTCNALGEGYYFGNVGVDIMNYLVGDSSIDQGTENENNRGEERKVRVFILLKHSQMLDLLNYNTLASLKIAEELDETRAVGNDILFCRIFQN